jgi:hypothetical protein
VKNCPEWLFAAIAALVARRYLTSTLGIEAFAARYAERLGRQYAAIPAEMIVAAAEAMLRHLSDAEAENADQVLHAYAHLRICTDGQGNPRKLRKLFGSELDGTKQPEYSSERTARDFKPFIYMLRLKPELAAPAGWGWDKIEDGDWLRTLPDLEVSLFDGL